MDLFHPATASWFREHFAAPTAIQRDGWPRIAAGGHALLIAPTGSGKTLAAFLFAIDTLMRESTVATPGIQLLYVSPLKALVHDVERNLRGPLAGIHRTAASLGQSVRPLQVDVRTGDTPQRERERQRRAPGDILVTTPESLYLMLGSRYRDNLRAVRTVVVDEVHALAPVKRGTHLALSLERLAGLAHCDPQRIGLSATVRPAADIAAFLGGDRTVEVIDRAEPPRLDLQVVVPVADMERIPEPAVVDGPTREHGDAAPGGGSSLRSAYAREAGTPPVERGIWSAIYPQVLDYILANRSTIVFVNSRGLCERLSQRLNDLAGTELVRAHHGSVSHEARTQMEDSLKRGDLRGIVATSSLELGIDMGSVDMVVQIESPGAVARGLQRVGRAGHQVGAVSSGRIFPKFRGDLLESAVIAARMLRGEIEAVQIPLRVLDVLAQQVVAIVCDSDRSPAELLALVRRAHPYRDLGEDALTAVLEMLSGHYPCEDFANLRPRLAWDRTLDRLSPRRGTAMVTRMNAGTIPDRGLYTVHLGEGGPRIGELDEEMVFETRRGDRLTLGASTWRVESISRDRVIVSAAPGEPGRLPFWRGDRPGRPIELGFAIGHFLRDIEPLSVDQAVSAIMDRTPLDRFAAHNLAEYVHEQKTHTGALATDQVICVERFRDELGDWRICILTPFGARVHAPWAMAIARGFAASSGFEVQIMYTDDGIVLRVADTDEPPGLDTLLPDPADVRDLVIEQLADTALFAGLFRENASRSLLIARRRPGQRSPLWAQRHKAQALLAAVRKYRGFPIVLETYRQALADIFDLPALEHLLGQIQARTMRVHEVETPSASPFARSLVFAYVAAYIYDHDQPLAERRAQALTLDKDLLAELLGQAQLRELLDADVMDAVEAQLQGCAGERQARDADELHDLLRRVGDLRLNELRDRCQLDPKPWLLGLTAQRRAIEVHIAGEPRFTAAEDAGLYRDALGVMPPSGLPDAFVVPVPDALERLLRRYARSHGPFRTDWLASRYQIDPILLAPTLEMLETRHDLVRGEFRPDGNSPEWCDPDVLRQIKRRTLAHLRNQIAALNPHALARFLPRWQQVGTDRGGIEALEETLLQLEGLALPWSSLIDSILPIRVRDFSVDMLDMLCARGQILWVGRGALGPRDGRVAIYRRNAAGMLLHPRAGEDPVPGTLAATIVEQLRERGACFVTDLEDAVQGERPEASASDIAAAMWDLIWNGRITNDTFAPLRNLRAPVRRRMRSGARSGAWTGARTGSTAASSPAGGRWDLVQVTDQDKQEARQHAEAAVARATMLLERYGIVTREAASFEGLEGGFAPVYRSLCAMEEVGRIRRGYFIEGLSGAQFAYPGTIDRLRATDPEGGQCAGNDDAGDGACSTWANPPADRVPGAGGSLRRPGDEPPNRRPADPPHPLVTSLLSVDPANPFGALLPWPPASDPTARPRRVPGAWLFLVAGDPVVYLSASGKQLLTFRGDEPDPRCDDRQARRRLEAALRATTRVSRQSGRRHLLSIEQIDGVPARDSIHAPLLLRCGFVRDYRGFTLVQPT